MQVILSDEPMKTSCSGTLHDLSAVIYPKHVGYKTKEAPRLVQSLNGHYSVFYQVKLSSKGLVDGVKRPQFKD